MRRGDSGAGARRLSRVAGRIPDRDIAAIRERVRIEDINERFRRVSLVYGYAEEPDVPQALLQCRRQGWKFDIMATSFMLSRRRVRISTRSRMPSWQGKLFIALSRK